MVRHPAEDQRSEQAGEQPGAEHAADLDRRRVPFARHPRNGDRRRADVVAVDHDDDESDDDESDMESADLLPVDDRREIDCACGGHGVSLSIFLSWKAFNPVQAFKSSPADWCHGMSRRRRIPTAK